jgi:hypothetical protein
VGAGRAAVAHADPSPHHHLQLMRQDQLATHTMLTVPANLVPYFRSGIFGEWGFTAEDIAQRALQFGSSSQGKGAYQGSLEAFEAGCALLDAVGWCEESASVDAEINLALHPRMILRALKNERELLIDQRREVPKRDKDSRNAVSAQVAALDAFVKLTEVQLRQLGLDRARSSLGAGWVNPLEPRQVSSSRARRPRH